MRTSRQTKQKELLLESINKINGFFTADELYNKIQYIDNKIGIATIYRFLKEQSKNQSLHSFNCENKTIYSINNKNHIHFICEKCGKKKHIKLNNVNFIKNIPEKTCHFQLDIYGICKECER